MLRRSFLMLPALFVTANAMAEEVLRVSAIPDEAPTELQRKFAPLGKYLESELGMKVQFVPVTDYAGVVEALLAMAPDGETVNFAQVLQAGSQVKVLAGPFADRIGTLERLTDQGRVQILLEMMGTSVRVMSRSDQLAPA